MYWSSTLMKKNDLQPLTVCLFGAFHLYPFLIWIFTFNMVSLIKSRSCHAIFSQNKTGNMETRHDNTNLNLKHIKLHKNPNIETKDTIINNSCL